jgi:predicted membrane GTPase involved in stress response
MTAIIASLTHAKTCIQDSLLKTTATLKICKHKNEYIAKIKNLMESHKNFESTKIDSIKMNTVNKQINATNGKGYTG